MGNDISHKYFICQFSLLVTEFEGLPIRHNPSRYSRLSDRLVSGVVSPGSRLQADSSQHVAALCYSFRSGMDQT